MKKSGVKSGAMKRADTEWLLTELLALSTEELHRRRDAHCGPPTSESMFVRRILKARETDDETELETLKYIVFGGGKTGKKKGPDA